MFVYVFSAKSALLQKNDHYSSFSAKDPTNFENTDSDPRAQNIRIRILAARYQIFIYGALRLSQLCLSPICFFFEGRDPKNCPWRRGLNLEIFEHFLFFVTFLTLDPVKNDYESGSNGMTKTESESGSRLVKSTGPTGSESSASVVHH